MSNFVEIFGENKVNLNKNLRVRLTLEDPKRMNIETNLFHDINQEAQFYTEKVACNKFRIHGTVSPSLNLHLRGGEKPNSNLFTFTDENWQIVLLKPTKNQEDKGIKQLHKEDIHQYDFNYGLPCLKVIPAQDEFKNYMAFNCYFGHNIQVDDRVYITSLDPVYLETGYYNVIGVDGNIVYIDEEYIEVIPDYDENEFTTDVSIDQQVAAVNEDLVAGVTIPTLTPPIFNEDSEFIEYFVTTKRKGLFRRKKKKVTEVRSKYVAAINMTNAAPDEDEAANNSELLHIAGNEIGILNPSVLQEITKKRPNISKIIKPQYFIKRVKEDYHLEYYMKQAEVIAIVNEFNDCGFSLSPTGEQLKNFTFEDIDLTNIRDNHGIPVTELILGIVKKSGNKLKDLANVEANFSKLIDYTDLGHGLETITTKQDGLEIDELKVGDKVMVGVCEYDSEQLLEVSINDVYHRTIHRDVSFAYKPFYPIKIKSFSSYIEDSETMANMPDYAVYSEIKQKYIWRDILDIGFFEEEGIGIDHKFLNGAFYLYNHIVFTLRNDFSVKYRYNTNDINRLDDVDFEIEGYNDILQDLLQDSDAQKDNNKGYKEFTNQKC